MNNQATNTSVVAIGGAVAVLVVGALHFFAVTAGFMESMGTTGDVAVTTLITAILGWALPADFASFGTKE